MATTPTATSPPRRWWPGAAPVSPTPPPRYELLHDGRARHRSPTPPTAGTPPRRSPTPTTPPAPWRLRPTGWATRSPSPTTPTATPRPRTTTCQHVEPERDELDDLLLRRCRREHPAATSTLTRPVVAARRSPSPSRDRRVAQPRRPAHPVLRRPTAATCSGQSATQRDYSYDAAGRVVYQGSSAQGSNANNIAYDASGDPTTISSHDSSGGNFDTYTQTFDDAGEVTAQTPVVGIRRVVVDLHLRHAWATRPRRRPARDGPPPTASTRPARWSSVTTPTSTASYLYTGDGLEAAATHRRATSPWGPPTDIDSTRSISDVTCTSTTFCVAVDTSGYATHLQRHELVDAHRRRLDPRPERRVVCQLELLRGRRHLGLCHHLQRHEVVDALRHRLDPFASTR